MRRKSFLMINFCHFQREPTGWVSSHLFLSFTNGRIFSAQRMGIRLPYLTFRQAQAAHWELCEGAGTENRSGEVAGKLLFSHDFQLSTCHPKIVFQNIEIIKLLTADTRRENFFYHSKNLHFARARYTHAPFDTCRFIQKQTVSAFSYALNILAKRPIYWKSFSYFRKI